MEPIADARGILLAAICILALMIGFGLIPAYAATRLQSQDHRPTGPYTMEEYNAEQACANDKNPSSQVKCLDAFVSKYPNSQLLPYAYLTYCKAYRTTPQVMKYAERVLSSKDEKPKFDVNDRFETALAWAEAYNTMRSTDFALAGKAREIAGIILELLAAIEKENVPHRKAFPEELRNAKLYLNSTAASAAMIMKDHGAASDSLAAVVALSVCDPSEFCQLPRLSAREQELFEIVVAARHLH